MPEITYTIPNGSAVGSPIDLRKYGEVRAISVPALTSGDLLIQGALSQADGSAPNSASFSRLLDTRAVGSGSLRFATGPGSCFIPFPFRKVMPPWIRLETAVAQGADRTFTILIRN
jgi:hypothetical protein